MREHTTVGPTLEYLSRLSVSAQNIREFRDAWLSDSQAILSVNPVRGQADGEATLT